MQNNNNGMPLWVFFGLVLICIPFLALLASIFRHAGKSETPVVAAAAPQTSSKNEKSVPAARRQSFTANALAARYGRNPVEAQQRLAGSPVRVTGTVEEIGALKGGAYISFHTYPLSTAADERQRELDLLRDLTDVERRKMRGEYTYGKGVAIQMDDDVTLLVPGHRVIVCATVEEMEGNAVLLSHGRGCK